MTIFNKIKNFCLDSKTGILSLKEELGINYHLVKIQLTETLIGLFLQLGEAMDYILTQPKEERNFDPVGFFSTRYDVLYIFGWLEFQISHQGMDTTHYQFPFDEMEKQFCAAVTKACKEEENEDIVLPEANKLPYFAKEAFFDDVKAELDMKDIHNLRGLYSVFTNKDVELFLDDIMHHEFSWADKKAAEILSKGEVRKSLTYTLENRTVGQAMAKMIAADPNHPWCRIKRLQDSVKDKKTVTVVATRDGKTYSFKMEANALLSTEGRYYLYNAKELRDVRIELDRVFDVLTINDVDRVEYRGKSIYQKEGKNND